MPSPYPDGTAANPHDSVQRSLVKVVALLGGVASSLSTPELLAQQIVSLLNTASEAAAGRKRTLTFSFSGGGSAIAENAKSIIRLSWGFTAETWTLIGSANAETGAAASASALVNIFVGNWSTSAFPSTDVVGSGTDPTLTNAIGATGTTDWDDEAWASGQVVMAQVAGGATAKWLTLIITGTET